MEFEGTLNSCGCSGIKCNDTAILGDGDHGTPALDVTAVHAWDNTVRITFHFPSVVRVTGINLYFYNIPSRNIGLPYDTYLTLPPSFIEGNQDLRQNDNQLRNVTLIPSATIEGKRFSIWFRFSNVDKIDWLLLTEVELCTSGILYSIDNNNTIQVAALALLLVLESRCAHFVIAHFKNFVLWSSASLASLSATKCKLLALLYIVRSQDFQD